MQSLHPAPKFVQICNPLANTSSRKMVAILFTILCLFRSKLDALKYAFLGGVLINLILLPKESQADLDSPETAKVQVFFAILLLGLPGDVNLKNSLLQQSEKLN